MLNFNRTFVAVAAFAAAASFSPSAQANVVGGALDNVPEHARFIDGRAATLAPMGYVVLCAHRPQMCTAGRGPTSLPWDTDLATVIDTVNRAVNASVVQVADVPAGGLSDVWTVANGTGDCEDIALLKRERLIAAGVPSRALRLAVATTPRGEGHAVLIVRTTQGDLVLDNRDSRIRLWSQTDLRWVKVQSAENPRRWHTV